MIDTPPPPHPQGLPGCFERDFVGCSHEALLAMLLSPDLDPAAFHRSLVEIIGQYGATHNQREIITAAVGKAMGINLHERKGV